MNPSGHREYRVRARQLLTFDTPDPLPPSSGDLRDRDDRIVGLIDDGVVEVRDGRVSWVGAWSDVGPDALPCEEVDVAMPGWVECHTHSLFAGSRGEDFWRRNAGETYASILEAGGGIRSTMHATRGATNGELVRSLRTRLRAFWDSGVCAVEVKTGYGLSVEHELRHLRLIREAAAESPVLVVATCLAGHVIPPERENDRSGYVDDITDRLLPRAVNEGLVDQVDVFCDRGALTVMEARRILTAGQTLGLGVRIHAEQLSASGATQLAAEMSARSADHLDYIDEADIAAMRHADVAAGLLPLCTVFLDVDKRPPARALVDAGVRVAVSTDFNPGSAHSPNLALAASLACSLFKLTPGEALRGVTRVPAEILNLGDRLGRLRAGSDARIVGFDVSDWRDIPWHLDGVAARWV